MEHEKTVDIPFAELTKWNDLLDAEWTDYETWDFPELSTVFCHTVKFDDGWQMDIKVNTDRKDDGDFFAEAVLFDKDGNQMGYTEPDWSLDGPPWCVSVGEDEYSVTVKGIET